MDFHCARTAFTVQDAQRPGVPNLPIRPLTKPSRLDEAQSVALRRHQRDASVFKPFRLKVGAFPQAEQSRVHEAVDALAVGNRWKRFWRS